MSEENEKLTLKQHIKMVKRGYKMLFTFSKKAMIWRSVNAVFQRFSPYLTLYMSSLIINEVIAGRDYKYLMLLVLITVGGNFLLHIIENIINRVAEKSDHIMWNIQDLYYMNKQNKMDYRFLDDADVTMMRTRIINAQNSGGNGFMQLYWSWWALLTSVADIIFSVALTFSLFTAFSAADQTGFLAFANSAWSSVVLLVIIIINVIASTLLANRSLDYQVMRQNMLSKMYMSSNAYWGISWSRDSKIFGFGDIAIPHVRRSNDPTFRNETANRLFLYGAVKTVMLALMNCILYLFVGAKAYMGVIGIGSIVLYHGTIQKFIDACGTLSWRASRLFKNNAYMQDIFDFFDLPEEEDKGTIPLDKDVPLDIEFVNVSFKYPKTDNYALKNISCKFKAGEKIAMVGCNGSGKTTLIKLLCRLYEPDEGKILLGGVPINEYKYSDYVAYLSAVFQDFYIFQFTIAENIAADSNYDADRVNDCIEKVGLSERVGELEKGIDSLIGRWYENNGIDLSGGENQKLAIARALYKNSPLVILDEPTASLDPIAESEIYSHFDNMVVGKTAVYISHRLSSCRFCNNIAVFNEGELTQFGSHGELIKDINGKYYELWNAQAQYYRPEE